MKRLILWLIVAVGLACLLTGEPVPAGLCFVVVLNELLNEARIHP